MTKKRKIGDELIQSMQDAIEYVRAKKKEAVSHKIEISDSVDGEHCPFCGAESYYHQVKPMKLCYKSNIITIQQPGYWCDTCKEGVLGWEDRKATQKTLQAFKEEIDLLI